MYLSIDRQLRVLDAVLGEDLSRASAANAALNLTTANASLTVRIAELEVNRMIEKIRLPQSHSTTRNTKL